MVGPKVSALDTKITILYIRYNMTVAAILIFDKCLYLRGRLRLTTARRLLFTLGHFTFWIILSLSVSLSPKFGLRPKISQKVKSFFVWTQRLR